MPSASAAGRLHGAEGGSDGNGYSPDVITATNVAQKGRIKRAWSFVKNSTKATMLWLSTGGTMVFIIYQIVFSWDLLPSWMQWLMPSEGAPAWAAGFAMIVGYCVSKTPHLFGQEPGDALGLVRETLFIIASMMISVVFLAAVHFHVNHAPNAVGINRFILVILLALLIGELVQAIVLARRTWTDSTGAAASA